MSRTRLSVNETATCCWRRSVNCAALDCHSFAARYPNQVSAITAARTSTASHAVMVPPRAARGCSGLRRIAGIDILITCDTGEVRSAAGPGHAARGGHVNSGRPPALAQSTLHKNLVPFGRQRRAVIADVLQRERLRPEGEASGTGDLRGRDLVVAPCACGSAGARQHPFPCRIATETADHTDQRTGRQ